MKSIFSALKSIVAFLRSWINWGDHLIDEPEYFDLYKPKSGHHFDICGMQRNEVIAICEALFSLGVAGYGLNYPADAILHKSVAIMIVQDSDEKLRIYFFSEDLINQSREDESFNFCKNPQSVKKLHDTIDFMYKKESASFDGENR